MNIFKECKYNSFYILYPTNLILTLIISDTVRNKWHLEMDKNTKLEHEEMIASLQNDTDLIEIHKTGYPFYSFYEYI